MSNVFYSKFSEVSGNRLDASYYIPALVELEKKVTNISSKKLKDFVLSISSGSTPKTTEQAKYYTEDKNLGIPFLRVQNLSIQGNIRLNNIKYINEDTHTKMLKRSQIEENDLLIKITGVGRMAIASVPEIGFKGNTNQHMVVVKTKNRLVSQTLASYLNLDIAEKLASRRATGGTRPALDYPALLSIPIIYNENIVQKMEQAHKQKQQKEQEAQRKLESIDSYLLDALGIELPRDKDDSLEDRVFFRKFSELKSRFDGVYYSEKFVALEKALLNSNYPLMRLGDICQINRGGSPRPIHNFITDDEDGINWIKIGDTKGIDKYIYQTKQKIIHKGIKHSRMVYEGDFILSNSMSFGRPYIMKTTGCIHDGWLLLRKKENIISEDFLYSILNSALIYKFFKKETIGGVVENLSIDLVKKIKIPLPPLEIQSKIANNNQKLLDEVEALKKEATEIYNNAKLEVEKMILGEG